MDFHFEYLNVAVLILPVAVFIFARKYRIRQIMIRRQQLVNKEDPLANRHFRKLQYMRLALYASALILIILALMRPVGNPQNMPTVKLNRDIFLLLDVSRSMLSRDVIPNRLEKAKEIIHDLVNALSGERIGLLIFSGNISIVSPLTSDYYFFLKSLDRVNTESLTKGGSEIGSAIDYTLNTLFKDDKQFKKSGRHIILITDGDNLASEPLEAAERAANKGVVIHTVSIGTKEGGKIPLNTSSVEYLKYDGKEVITRPDETMLKNIAAQTGGIFIPAGSAKVYLGDIYKEYFTFDSGESDEKQSEAKIWTEYYRYFLFFALMLILLEKPLTVLMNRKHTATEKLSS